VDVLIPVETGRTTGRHALPLRFYAERQRRWKCPFLNMIIGNIVLTSNK